MKKLSQSANEIVIVAACVIAAILIMGTYVKRSMSGKLRSLADSGLGEQFDPVKGNTIDLYSETGDSASLTRVEIKNKTGLFYWTAYGTKIKPPRSFVHRRAGAPPLETDTNNAAYCTVIDSSTAEKVPCTAQFLVNYQVAGSKTAKDQQGTTVLLIPNGRPLKSTTVKHTNIEWEDLGKVGPVTLTQGLPIAGMQVKMPTILLRPNPSGSSVTWDNISVFGWNSSQGYWSPWPTGATYTTKESLVCGNSAIPARCQDNTTGDWVRCPDCANGAHPQNDCFDSGCGVFTDVAPVCTYTYSDWGECKPEGKQTRTPIASPPGCMPGVPLTSQTCIPKCTYTYTAWSTCQGGTQTRNATKSAVSPADCIPETLPLSQACLTQAEIDANWAKVDFRVYNGYCWADPSKPAAYNSAPGPNACTYWADYGKHQIWCTDKSNGATVACPNCRSTGQSPYVEDASNNTAAMAAPKCEDWPFYGVKAEWYIVWAEGTGWGNMSAGGYMSPGWCRDQIYMRCYKDNPDKTKSYIKCPCPEGTVRDWYGKSGNPKCPCPN